MPLPNGMNSALITLDEQHLKPFLSLLCLKTEKSSSKNKFFSSSKLQNQLTNDGEMKSFISKPLQVQH